MIRDWVTNKPFRYKRLIGSLKRDVAWAHHCSLVWIGAQLHLQVTRNEKTFAWSNQKRKRILLSLSLKTLNFEFKLKFEEHILLLQKLAGAMSWNKITDWEIFLFYFFSLRNFVNLFLYYILFSCTDLITNSVWEQEIDQGCSIMILKDLWS